MKFWHPVIGHGRIGHPVHGEFPIMDGVIDCPEALGLELRAERVVDATDVAPAAPGAETPPSLDLDVQKDTAGADTPDDAAADEPGTAKLSKAERKALKRAKG